MLCQVSSVNSVLESTLLQSSSQVRYHHTQNVWQTDTVVEKNVCFTSVRTSRRYCDKTCLFVGWFITLVVISQKSKVRFHQIWHRCSRLCQISSLISREGKVKVQPPCWESSNVIVLLWFKISSPNLAIRRTVWLPEMILEWIMT